MQIARNKNKTEIKELSDDMLKNPLVSICVVAYQHIDYIEQCIDGILMQKVNFPVEIIVHDDASSDGTADIIRKYENNSPSGLIKPIYQSENQYSKGIKPMIELVYPHAIGKYIAICDGDDYWNNPNKLQKQVDFLEENPDCSLCFHASKYVHTSSSEDYYIHRPKRIPPNNKFKMKHVILGGGGFMATNSMVFCSEYILGLPEWIDKAPVGDLPLMLILSTKGNIGYINEVLSVYRIMSNNSWSSRKQNREISRQHRSAMVNMWDEFDKWTNKKYHYFVIQKKMKDKGYYLKKTITSRIKKTNT